MTLHRTEVTQPKRLTCFPETMPLATESTHTAFQLLPPRQSGRRGGWLHCGATCHASAQGQSQAPGCSERTTAP